MFNSLKREVSIIVSVDLMDTSRDSSSRIFPRRLSLKVGQRERLRYSHTGRLGPPKVGY